MLCSKSAWVEGRRQPGPVHVACRIWDRCRSLTPGSRPRAWYRWSHSLVAIGSSMTRRSCCPPAPVCSRQLPYPPGGPGWRETVKVNPGPSLVLRGGPRFSRCLLRPWGSGRAQPWPIAWPSWSVTVTHQVVAGSRAAAPTRSRVNSGSMGPEAGDLAGPVGQVEQGGQRDGQVDLPGEPGRQRAVRAVPGLAVHSSGVRAAWGALAGPGVPAEQQVQVGAGPQLVHAAGQRRPSSAAAPRPRSSGPRPGPGPAAAPGRPGRRFRTPQPTALPGRPAPP